MKPNVPDWQVPELVNDFLAVRRGAPNLFSADQVVLEHVPPPHAKRSLRKGMCAVYVFSLTPSHGATCAAGPRRVLKVGRVGINSDARFRSQHYGPGRSGSNLARSITSTPEEWTSLGISRMDDRTVEDWLRTHTCRDHIFIPAGYEAQAKALETYLHHRLNPLFEGRRA
jgi:hypothetical protein